MVLLSNPFFSSYRTHLKVVLRLVGLFCIIVPSPMFCYVNHSQMTMNVQVCFFKQQTFRVQNVWLWSSKVSIVFWMCKLMKFDFITFMPRKNWVKHKQSQIWASSGWMHGWCSIVPSLWSQSNLSYFFPIHFIIRLHAFYFNFLIT